MSANLAAVFAVDGPERRARLRELRMAAHLLLGRKDAVTVAAAEAIADSAMIDFLLGAIDDLEAIPRRRLLATLAAIFPCHG